MNLEKIFDLLPLDVTEDLYFQRLIAIVVDNLKDASQLISKIQVNEEIYENMDNKDLVSKQEGNTLVNILYRLKDSICSFAVKQGKESYYIYFEVKSFDKMARTILIKTPYGIVVETKESLKVNGFYKSYDSNLYYYDNNYKEIKSDTSEALNKLFSDEFGIPLKSAENMRRRFPLYANYLSYSASEQRMKKRDNSLNDIDFLYFRSPWLVSDVREFIEEEYNNDKQTTVKKYLNQDSNRTSLKNMVGIEQIIEWIQNNLRSDSEFVISNNIYQNLIPVMVGEDAGGFNTRGIIVEKAYDDYYIYEVHFITNRISFRKRLISMEEAQKLFFSNSLNSNVDGLSQFFGIARGR